MAVSANNETLLIANRGEIAIRIVRTARRMGLKTVAVYSEDDAGAPHISVADVSVPLSGSGPAAYLNQEQLLRAAADTGAKLLHPGYGFLSENADFAQMCERAGLVFVGADAEGLRLFGDKARCRAFAKELKVPVLPGTFAVTSLEEARAFLRSCLADTGAPMMIKALAGGGGRGMRRVTEEVELEAAWAMCQGEAQAAFGSGELYVEQAVSGARHLEVQLLSDGAQVMHLWERECSLQRRQQKLLEVTPALNLPDAMRKTLLHDALKLGRKAGMKGLATVEFLVPFAASKGEAKHYFIEVNPRLQVEHTITEQTTGVDLVRIQLALAMGQTLSELGLDAARPPPSRGASLQLRICAERLLADGTPVPSGGQIIVFEPPTGAGVRVDSAACAGSPPNPRFELLFAKLIDSDTEASSPDLLVEAQRLLGEFRLQGMDSNIPFLQSLLAHPEVAGGNWHTGLVEELLPSLHTSPAESSDSLAASGGDGTGSVSAPMTGVVLSLEVAEGASVRAGMPLLVLEAMKMEHLITAAKDGVLACWHIGEGDAVSEGSLLYQLEDGQPQDGSEGNDGGSDAAFEADDGSPRMQEMLQRHAAGMDENRPDAVARRRKTGQRTARENLEDLCDEGSFTEYGALVIAAQRRRRDEADLIARTPADGLVMGTATVNGAMFAAEQARCAVLAYDYTVLAGTQGQQNHRKKDRLFALARDLKLPVVLFAEGGGGRPGDTDGLGVAGLDCLAFQYFAALSGLVPLVGIASGRCFAGNAALLGCCDLVIATEGTNIGMGGPAMIEGGGLGVFRPEDIGPINVQRANGVVDVAVSDEAEAVQVARKYLSFFQGKVQEYTCADQLQLRTVIPANRRRVYDVRSPMRILADTDSLLELRADFAPGMVTALARLAGQPIGIIANNSTHEAGAITSDNADKASRFMQLCDAFDIPLLMLCDTPGIMVGPQAEETALVRHAARMFVTGASLNVPFITVVLRRAYGLGAQAMAGGSFRAPMATLSWPSGEFGGMGLEGAVRLGFRRELEAEKDAEKREQMYQEMVERMYRHGRALNTASHYEIDAVIDPAQTRDMVLRLLAAAPLAPSRQGKKRPFVDSW